MGLTGYRTPIIAVMLVILSCACPLAIADARAGNGMPLEAAAAAWSVRTEFGGFDISLDPGLTQIACLTVHLDGYSCGGVSVKGHIQADSRNMWPIAGNRFRACTSLGIYEIVITGTIDGDGKSACGTWSVGAAGTTCSGAWKTD
jgi:hypothetical protein